MDVPPGVACLDTRHPRRLLAPEQVPMRFSIYDRPSARSQDKGRLLGSAAPNGPGSCDLLRTPSTRSSENSPSTHSGEQGLGPNARVVPDLGDAFPAASSPIARSLPRCASGGLFQGLQGRRTIHAGAPYEVDCRGVDLVDERVDA